CRTTVHWDLISPAELEELALRLQQQGVTNYAVQLVRHANTLLYPLPKVPPPADLNPLWQRLEQRFEQFTVRSRIDHVCSAQRTISAALMAPAWRAISCPWCSKISVGMLRIW